MDREAFNAKARARLDKILDDIAAETGAPKQDVIKGAIEFLSKGAA